MKRLQGLLLVGTLFSAVFATGCSRMVRQPEIQLTGVRVGGLGLRGGTMVAVLEITNPNSFEVETRAISYDLKVSDRDSANQETWIDFAKGVFEEKIEVGDHDKRTVEVPIEFTYAALGGAMRSILDRGTFNYKVEGTVQLREPIRKEIPYRHLGNISMAGVR